MKPRSSSNGVVRSVLLASVLLLAAENTSADTIHGRIIGITDGDTVKILTADHTDVKVRLAGIDAPEKRQAFGDRSKTNLSRMAFQQNVEADCGKTDRYQRRVCVLYVGGIDLNLEQVRQGMAWHYKKYEREQSPRQREEYAAAEFNAKVRRVGLWSEKNPVPPWEFRHP
jgi:endonuclease YncB( thermonuclease family)